jgi:putative SOS response-associated peptidase YedK
MCGRFSLAAAPELLQQHFQIKMGSWPALQPRYNIAPSQLVLAVVASTELGRKATQFRWGLIPRWSRAPQAGWINARSETVAEKPSFREAFRRRRCLIPADGFYEWAEQGTAKRQPYWFYLVDRPVFAFAGIWERWRSPQGVEIETCAILNTPANRLMGLFHERMPAILPESDYELWLDPQVQDPKWLLPLLRPYPAEAMAAYPVSTHVNNPRHEDPTCRAPIGEAVQGSNLSEPAGSASPAVAPATPPVP